MTPLNHLKTFLITLSLFLIGNFSFGQNDAPIIGTVVNPQNEPLEFVSVALLHPTDSTMINFTTTDIKGNFKIVEDSKDSLLIQFFSTGYIALYKDIVYQNELMDLSKIILEENIDVLDEVIISAVIPIEIKKDTIAFNANSFKVNADDNIENLLEKLPGMEIDPNGTIVAQGNEVTKIFVDGKEFFGGDPAVVLKNLSADVISKVEVIDKKSDESELTGVSDGNKQVVLNFTLKKDKKNQGFGKASAGVGLDNRYFANINYNRFSSKTQFSAVGKTNNINVTGSNIKDFLQNANGLGDESDEDATVSVRNLSGFLDTQIAGIHFGHEFQKKESLNADYTFNASDNDGISYTQRTSFIGDNNYNSNYTSAFDNQNKNHKFNFNYINQSNKTNSLFVKGNYDISDRATSLNKYTYFYNTSEELRTTNDNRYNNKNDRSKGNIRINFYQKLNNEGRNLSTSASFTQDLFDRFNKQYLLSTRKIDQPTPTFLESSIFRDEIIETHATNYNLKYTEPLGNHHYIKIETNNTFGNIDEDVTQSKTIISNDNQEELLKYKYKHKEYNYQTRLGYSYNIPKLNIYAGAELQDLTREFGEIDQNPIKKTDQYINPRMSAQYTPKPGKKYRLNYSKTVRSPKTQQSSTVINDLNPYYIRKGNPDLSPEQNDAVTVRVNIHDYASSLSLYGKITYQHTDNAIIPTIVIDDNFIRTRSFENSGTKNNLSTSFSFSKKINGLGIRYTLKNRNSYILSNALVNKDLNDLTAKNFSGSIQFQNYNKKRFDLKVGATYTINQTDFSIVKDLNREFVTQRYYTMFDYDITKKLNINTQFDYYLYSDSKFSSNRKLPLWNTAISYSLTRKKNNIIKLLFIDMLDKNIDIHRRSNLNYFEETTTESLGRYVVVSYTYRLNNGSNKTKTRKKGKKS